MCRSERKIFKRGAQTSGKGEHYYAVRNDFKSAKKETIRGPFCQGGVKKIERGTCKTGDFAH